MRKLFTTICLLLVLSGCKDTVLRHEFTTENIFLIQNISAENITLYGIGLGASIPDVIAVFGQPDAKKEYIFEGQTNLEYGQKINLTENGLIFHFDNGTMTRLTIKEPFTEHYLTKTQLNITKKEVYGWLGIPEKQTNVLDYRVFTYTTRGVDVFLKGRNVNRVSFFR